MHTRINLAGPEEARELRARLDRYEAARRILSPSRAEAERAIKYPLLAFGVFRHRGISYRWDTDDDSLVRGLEGRRIEPLVDGPHHIQHFTFHRRGIMPDDEERNLWTYCPRGRTG